MRPEEDTTPPAPAASGDGAAGPVRRLAPAGLSVHQISRQTGIPPEEVSRVLREVLPPEIEAERRRQRQAQTKLRRRNIEAPLDVRKVAALALSGLTVSEMSLRLGVPTNVLRHVLKEVLPPQVEQARVRKKARRNNTGTENRLRATAEWLLDDDTKQRLLKRIREVRLVRRVAGELGLPPRVVEWAARQAGIVTVKEHGVKMGGHRNDEQLLDGMRLAWKEMRPDGSPLPMSAYNDWAASQPVKYPTDQIVRIRFGSWRKACRLAGVPETERNITPSPARWTKEQCRHQFDRWTKSQLRKTSNRDLSVLSYSVWAKRHSAPSHATIRKYLMSGNKNWFNILAESLARVDV